MVEAIEWLDVIRVVDALVQNVETTTLYLNAALRLNL